MYHYSGVTRWADPAWPARTGGAAANPGSEAERDSQLWIPLPTLPSDGAVQGQATTAAVTETNRGVANSQRGTRADSSRF